MNISGIRPMEGFYTNSREKAAGREPAEIRAEQEERLRPEEDQADQAVLDQQMRPGEEAEQSLTAYDYAQDFRPDAEYGLRGKESSLLDLDMERAISDMQKDQLLRQYQFFVGSSRQGILESSDVLLKNNENFMV